MDLNKYRKTRYQNIYKHIKNGNYVITVTEPRATTISKDFNNNRIYDIELAKKIKESVSLKKEYLVKLNSKDLFKNIWEKYIKYCEEVEKLSFNTMKKKKNFYKAHYIYFEDYKITKISKEDIISFMKKLHSPDKQKNEILKILKCFFNWCVQEGFIDKSPTHKIKEIKTTNSEMKYWSPEEFKKYIDYLDLVNNEYSRRIKLLCLIEFSLGDRIGETRALTWDSINTEHKTISIKHSINYDPNTNNYLSHTKNYQSQRVIDITDRLIDEINEYKDYLIEMYGEVNNIIFYNYTLKKPYSDTALRKQFYKFIDEVGITKIRLYDLRHTYVTIMMSEGWELYHISKRLGHKNYATTVDKYGHIESNTRKEIAKTTDKYF